MPERFRLFLLNGLYGLLPLLYYFPALLAMSHWLVSASDRWLWLASLPLFCLMAVALHDFGKLKNVFVHIGLAALCGGFAGWHFAGWSDKGYVAAALYLLCWFRGANTARKPRRKEFPEVHFWLGLGLYVVMYFVYRFYPLLQSDYPLFAWAGAAMLAVCLYMLNLMNLETVSTFGKGSPVVSAVMMRHNLLYLTGLVALVFIAAHLHQLKSLLAWIFGLLGGSARRVMIMPPVPGFSAGTVGHFDGPSVSFTEARGTGEMASWLKIALAVVLGAMAIAVLYLLFRFFLHLLKLLIVVFRWTFRWLLGFDRLPATGAGYRDEMMAVERAMPDERGYVDRLRRWIDELLAREPRWEQLKTPAEKVRYLYRRRLLVSMRRGYEFKPQLTPRETEHDLLKWRKSDDVPCGEIVPLYEQARYGDGEPDPERVERLREQMRKSGYHT